LQGVRVVVFEPEVDDVDSVDEMNTVDIVDRERTGAGGGADE
jgi:hypothetical protein